MTETISQIVMELVTNPDAVTLAADVVLDDHAQDRVYQGRAEVESLLRTFFVQSFPGGKIEVYSSTSDASSAVLEFYLHGRQDGPLLGLPATGRQVALPMVVVCQFSDDQVRRVGLYYDAGSLLRQLGLAL